MAKVKSKNHCLMHVIIKVTCVSLHLVKVWVQPWAKHPKNTSFAPLQQPCSTKILLHGLPFSIFCILNYQHQIIRILSHFCQIFRKHQYPQQSYHTILNYLYLPSSKHQSCIFENVIHNETEQHQCHSIFLPQNLFNLKPVTFFASYYSHRNF